MTLDISDFTEDIKKLRRINYYVEHQQAVVSTFQHLNITKEEAISYLDNLAQAQYLRDIVGEALVQKVKNKYGEFNITPCNHYIDYEREELVIND